MTLVIGTDEAGYGPNLGPLVVAATAWRVATEPAEVEPPLLAALRAAAAVQGGVPLWGDSKKIYRAGAGLAALERGVLAAVSLVRGGEPFAWPGFAATLGIAAEAPAGRPADWPAHERGHEVAAALRGPLAAAGVSLDAIRCRIVEPAEFNGLLDRGLNKSDILSEITLGLAADLAATAPGEPVVIWCDRHGGRSRYAPLVSRAFAATLVQPLEETPRRSRYRFGAARLIEFAVAGEERLPVAVASMTAKYVRERSMLAFNEFWRRRQPGLGPTAGYPVDARRWRAEAATAVAASGIPWDDVWRRA